MARRLLVLVAVSLALAALPTAHAVPAAPAVSVSRVDGITLQGQTAILDLTLAISNPNGLEMPLHKLWFRLQFNALDVAHGESTAPVTIPARGRAQVPVEVNVDSATLLTLFATLPPDGTVNYLISGSAEIGMTMLRIPFSDSGKVRLALQ